MKAWLACLAVSLSCFTLEAADPPEPSDKLTKHLGADVVKLVRSADAAEVFRVSDFGTPGGKAGERTVGLRVVTGDAKNAGETLSKELAARLRAALLDDATYFNGDSLGTGVGVAYRLTAPGGGVVEVSCCLVKGNVYLTATDAAGKILRSGRVGGFRNDGNSAMRILAADALPDDAAVQKSRPKPPAVPAAKDTQAADKAGTAGSPSPFEPGAKVQKLADGFAFTEGPSADRDGNVYFSDQPSDRILKWSVDGKLSTFLEKSGRANGLCFDADGKLWSCSDAKNELWKIDVATKEHQVVAKDYKGKLLNGPNDVWVAPNGGVYFSDPFYKRKWWERGPEEQDKRGVYHVSAKGVVSRVAEDFKQPNGVIGTADGKTLYVADIGAKQTFAFDVKDDGTLANRRKFCDAGSDGMTLDSDGNVYLTGGGVVVFDKAGKKIAELAVPEQPSNLCFGGKDQKTLFITARTSLYSVPTRVSAGARQ